MGKKLLHASHFNKSLRKRSPHRYSQIKDLITNDTLRVYSNKRINDASLFKYWRNRKRIFYNIDENNIYMTRELWYSVTPENIAIFVAKFVKACIPEAKYIWDIFCGGGGNTIQFAKRFPHVIGIDANVEHLYCTAMNCQAYGVADKVWLRKLNWGPEANLKYMNTDKIDLIFASPPWGGPQYLKEKVYDVEKHLLPMGLTELLQTFIKYTNNIILFLPRNSDLNQISRATETVMGSQTRCKILFVKDQGYTKGILCIWGEPLTNYAIEEDDTENTSQEKNSKQDDDNENENGFDNTVVETVDLYDLEC